MAERWHASFHPAFDAEFQVLPEVIQDEVVALAGAIAVAGPQLGRPRVDTLKGSKHANMKEGRFKAEGGVWRVAFAFDPERKAVLPVGGDKSGVSQKRFYRADRQGHERFDEHLTYLAGLKEAKHR